MAEVGTGGLASPIVIPLDIAANVTGASLFVHGRFIWNKSIQNTKDTIQEIQSSGGGKVQVLMVRSQCKEGTLEK